MINETEHLKERLREAESLLGEILRLANHSRATVEAPRLWAELLECLGLALGASKWNVEAAIRELRQASEGGPYKVELTKLVGMIERAAQNSKYVLQQPATEEISA